MAGRGKTLKCFLSGRPLLLIKHLQQKNYRVSFTVLKNKYIEEDEIIDNIFQDILDFSIKQEKHFATLTEFISKIASLLAQLESSFGCIFSDDRASGARLYGKNFIFQIP